MGAHANSFSGKTFRRLNAARLVHKHVAVTEFSVRENRDGRKRCAVPHPAKKYAHLQLADVKFEISGETAMALFGGQRENLQIDPLRFDGSVDQKAGAVVLVAGKRQSKVCHVTASVAV